MRPSTRYTTSMRGSERGRDTYISIYREREREEYHDEALDAVHDEHAEHLHRHGEGEPRRRVHAVDGQPQEPPGGAQARPGHAVGGGGGGVVGRAVGALLAEDVAEGEGGLAGAET